MDAHESRSVLRSARYVPDYLPYSSEKEDRMQKKMRVELVVGTKKEASFKKELGKRIVVFLVGAD